MKCAFHNYIFVVLESIYVWRQWKQTLLNKSFYWKQFIKTCLWSLVQAQNEEVNLHTPQATSTTKMRCQWWQQISPVSPQWWQQPSPCPTQTQTAGWMNRWTTIPISVDKLKVSYLHTLACQNVDHFFQAICSQYPNSTPCMVRRMGKCTKWQQYPSASMSAKGKSSG